MEHQVMFIKDAEINGYKFKIGDTILLSDFLTKWYIDQGIVEEPKNIQQKNGSMTVKRRSCCGK
jgi:hypothetical protein